MNSLRPFSLFLAVTLLAAGAAQARGPSPQPWLIYPMRAMDSCRAGTAPQHIEARCSELLEAYSHKLLACLAVKPEGAVLGLQQVNVQKDNPDCAATAARLAAASVK